MDAENFIHAITSNVNTARTICAHEQEATQNEYSYLPLLMYKKTADAKLAKFSGADSTQLAAWRREQMCDVKSNSVSERP